MLQHLLQITDSEIRIFKELLKLEREKRKAVLSADGRNLQRLTAECENLILKIGKAEEEREDLLSRSGADGLNADTVAHAAEKENPALAALFLRKKNELKELVSEISTIVKENEILLNQTTGTITRLLKGLQKPADRTYAPADYRKQYNAESLLISTNA